MDTVRLEACGLNSGGFATQRKDWSLCCMSMVYFCKGMNLKGMFTVMVCTAGIKEILQDVIRSEIKMLLCYDFCPCVKKEDEKPE